jgi:hypothetical protein
MSYVQTLRITSDPSPGSIRSVYFSLSAFCQMTMSSGPLMAHCVSSTMLCDLACPILLAQSSEPTRQRRPLGGWLYLIPIKYKFQHCLQTHAKVMFETKVKTILPIGNAIPAEKPQPYHAPLLFVSYMPTLQLKKRMNSELSAKKPCHSPAQKPAGQAPSILYFDPGPATDSGLAIVFFLCTSLV